MPRPTFHNLPAAKQQRIVDAAIEELGSRPYTHATLDRIVDAAGISKGSMYQYFEGKADLYGWLVTGYLADKKLAALGSHLPVDGETLWALFERMYVAGLRFAIDEPALTKLAVRFHRDHQLEPELTAIAAASRSLAHRYLCESVAASKARGELRADLDVDVFAKLLQHALGEGMLELLAARLKLDLDAMLADPDRLRALDDTDVRALVAEVLRTFRDGAGASP